MQSETVFVKTARGIEELEHRSLGLSATTRRLLILIDGQRTVGQLIHDNARSMDVAAALEQLHAHGLVTERGHAPAPPTEAAPAAPAKNADTPPRVALVEMCKTVLGAQHAERISAKLENIPDDADELRKAIDNCVRLIRLTIDEGKAEDFRRQAEVILRSI